MLDFLFGFNARVDRGRFFFCTLVMGAITGLLFAMATGRGIHGMMSPLKMLALVKGWPATIVVALAAWAFLMLQSMRLRDAGWNPAFFLTVWIGLLAVDHFVAVKIPAWSIPPDYFMTYVGGAINLAMFMVLQFSPGQVPDTNTFKFPRQDSARRREPPISRAESRLARISRNEFGQRKL